MVRLVERSSPSFRYDRNALLAFYEPQIRMFVRDVHDFEKQRRVDWFQPNFVDRRRDLDFYSIPHPEFAEMRQGSFARILFGGFISEELVASGIQLERINWIDFHNVLASRDDLSDEDGRTKKVGRLKRMRFVRSISAGSTVIPQLLASGKIPGQKLFGDQYFPFGECTPAFGTGRHATGSHSSTTAPNAIFAIKKSAAYP
ncbi:hypothetical protein IE4872_PD00086 (plasmid) [Rhizobium gallicum]|uniref:Uncharacterized protein n=1 Tax=Rhizobium gallicum TaxID=56730 RepID=A0A1L5NRZ7_9HYPH|nr:hypothetical protein [Rhizobium gallicum]APO70629.1 hypothetical protein IE4872_PD00086 [Rhizobium gallicum]